MRTVTKQYIKKKKERNDNFLYFTFILITQQNKNNNFEYNIRLIKNGKIYKILFLEFILSRVKLFESNYLRICTRKIYIPVKLYITKTCYNFKKSMCYISFFYCQNEQFLHFFVSFILKYKHIYSIILSAPIIIAIKLIISLYFIVG